MSGRVLVCGHFGREARYAVENHPRFGIAGVFAGSVLDTRMQFGGDGYHITRLLTDLAVPTSVAGIVGRDTAGESVHAEISAAGIDCRYLVRAADAATPELFYLTDQNGIINSYVHDRIPSIDRPTPFAEIDGDIDLIVVSSLNRAMRHALFAAIERADAPVLWYVQGHVCDLEPDRLLRYVHRSRYLVMGAHEEHYICNTLGLSTIESLLREGPEAIVVVGYEPAQGLYVYNVFTSVPLSSAQFSSLAGRESYQYRDVMLGFVAGVACAVHSQHQLESALKIGTACSREYVHQVENPAYQLQRDAIIRAS